MTAIIVEFVLIVISLIAAVILGGFTFGTIGIYVPPAEVAAQVTGCAQNSGGEVCQMTLANQGVHPVQTYSNCTMTISGAQVQGTLLNGGTVPASGSLPGVDCKVHGATVAVGSRLVGSVLLSNGGTVFFTAIAS